MLPLRCAAARPRTPPCRRRKASAAHPAGRREHVKRARRLRADRRRGRRRRQSFCSRTARQSDRSCGFGPAAAAPAHLGAAERASIADVGAPLRTGRVCRARLAAAAHSKGSPLRAEPRPPGGPDGRLLLRRQRPRRSRPARLSEAGRRNRAAGRRGASARRRGSPRADRARRTDARGAPPLQRVDAPAVL